IVWPFLLSLAASLLVALTLTPLLCAWAFRGVTVRATTPSVSWPEERYRGLLRRALDHRAVVLFAALAA
ncbi:efflux RND transporter permease subunit, partial [Vibrio parahaemolyticus]